MDRCTGHPDVTDIMTKTAFNTIHSTIHFHGVYSKHFGDIEQFGDIHIQYYDKC